MQTSEATSHATPNLRVGEVEPNPIGIDAEAARAICDSLNQDLSTLYVGYHQLKKHHWLIEGPDFRDVHLLLDELAKSALESADEFAERVTNLGGVPPGSPAAQENAAVAQPEPEGRFPARVMLENDLALLQAAVGHLRQTVAVARRHDDYGTVHLAQEVLYHQEDSVQRLSHVLASESLEPHHAP